MTSRLFVLAVAVLGLVCLVSADFNCVPFSQYRTFDGTCNNIILPALGSAGQLYRRGDEGAEYDPDGSPVSNRPIERVVSNKVSRADPSHIDPIRHSMMATQFGQFVNHDLNNNGFDDPDTLTYPDHLDVPELDDSFCWVFASPINITLLNKCLPPFNQVPLFTTKFSEKVIVDGTAEIVDHSTAWLDLSPVYGSNPTTAALLRTGSGGRLLTNDYLGVTTSPGQVFGLFQFNNIGTFDCVNCPPSFTQTGGQVRVPPLMNPNLPNAFGYSGTKIFVAGDERVGENAALSMFHTLFLRNHNRHAQRLQAKHPDWDDEKIFQRARRRNIAEYQNVVMYQYVPTEFGEYFSEKVGPYNSYRPYLDPEINIAFATAAFRYGHSSFRNYAPVDSCGADTLFGKPANGAKLVFGGQTGGPILPIDVYCQVGSWENVIRGLVATRTAPNDVMIDSALRDLPFGFPFAGGTDVWVLDLHRGRENGVANYVDLQKEYGKNRDKIYGSDGCPERYSRNQLPDPLECFTKLVPYNLTLAQNLQSLYGKVNRIDALMGLMAEPHVPGTSFGETLGNIIMDTYRRIRDGDRFWFENPFQPLPFSQDTLEEIRDVTMGELLRKNFDFPANSQVPGNPFLTPNNYISNLAGSC